MKKTREPFSILSDRLNSKYPNTLHSTFAIALKSSRTIKKIATIWPHLYQSHPFSGVEANVCRPIHFQRDQLTIECDSPTALNHLRFNQSYLLKQLHKYGFNEILLLRLTIKHKANHAVLPEKLTEKKQPVTQDCAETVSTSTLNSIKVCANTTHTPLLKDSLNRLLASIKNKQP